MRGNAELRETKKMHLVEALIATPNTQLHQWPDGEFKLILAASSQTRGRPSRSLPIQVPTTIHTCVFLEGVMPSKTPYRGSTPSHLRHNALVHAHPRTATRRPPIVRRAQTALPRWRGRSRSLVSLASALTPLLLASPVPASAPC